MSKDVSWIFRGTLYQTLTLKLGRLIPKVLPCMVYCMRVADDDGPKGSTTHSIQTGLDLIAEEGYAVTTRVVTGIGLLCPWLMQSQAMYGDPTLILTHTSDLMR